MIYVSSECGDSTIRHFIRTGTPFSVESINPNPATNRLNVELHRLESGSIAYQIVGIDGSIIQSGSDLQTPLDTRALPSGAYNLRLEQSGYVLTRRFEIAR
jgi:hypothetical protein